MSSKRRFEAIARRHGFEFKEGKLVEKEKAAEPEGKVTLGLGKATAGKKRRDIPAPIKGQITAQHDEPIHDVTRNILMFVPQYPRLGME